MTTFDDRYLGAKSSAPTVDNDGDALITGALYFNSTTNIMNVYGSGGWQSAGSAVNGTSERNTYTATAGQTVFAATYDTGYIDVYLNGVKLLSGTDFTATNGTSITLASGASVNDVVDIVAYGTFELADHYTRTASDARYVQPTHTGNLDITGTVTSDGLTVDGSSQTTSLLVNTGSTAWADSNADDLIIRGADVGITISSSATGGINFGDSTSATKQGQITYTHSGDNLDFYTATNKRLGIAGNGDISFYEDTGTTAKFFWDASAESLGIGTSSPSAPLTLTGSDTSSAFATFNTGNSAEITSYSARASLELISYQSDGGSPYTKTSAIIANGDGTVPSEMQFWTKTNGQSSPAERMRLDSSGNLLLGKSVTTFANNGVALKSQGEVNVTRNDGVPFYIRRNTSDGDIVQFWKDGTTVGSIQSRAGAMLSIAFNPSGSDGAGFTGGSNAVLPTNATALSDNSIDLGVSSYRYKDLYLSGTTHANQYRLKNGNATTGGLFHEKDLVGSGSSYDTSLFAETGNALHFMVNGSATAVGTFDTSGSLMVGKTALGVANAGFAVRNFGTGSGGGTTIELAKDDATAMYINRTSSNGTIIDFRKDGSTVGSIGNPFSTAMYITGPTSTGSGFVLQQDDKIYPAKAGARADNYVDLGGSVFRYKDAYLSGGVYLGGTGSANKLDDYEEGTWTPVFNNFSATGTYHQCRIICKSW